MQTCEAHPPAHAADCDQHVGKSSRQSFLQHRKSALTGEVIAGQRETLTDLGQ